MDFTLTGFTQSNAFRVFAFERVESDRSRVRYTVRTDLNLSRSYGIRQQELPLLCRAFLETTIVTGGSRALTFSEDQMRVYASTCEAARLDAAAKRKPYRRPPVTRA